MTSQTTTLDTTTEPDLLARLSGHVDALHATVRLVGEHHLNAHRVTVAQSCVYVDVDTVDDFVAWTGALGLDSFTTWAKDGETVLYAAIRGDAVEFTVIGYTQSLPGVTSDHTEMPLSTLTGALGEVAA